MRALKRPCEGMGKGRRDAPGRSTAAASRVHTREGVGGIRAAVRPERVCARDGVEGIKTARSETQIHASSGPPGCMGLGGE